MSFKFTQPVRLSGKASLKATVFTVPQIFAGGVTGAFYLPDPQDVYGANSLASYGEGVSVVLDEKNGTPMLGPELVDTANVATSWIAYGTNTLTQDGDAVKITFVSDAPGAYLYLTQAGGLNSNLVSGKTYRLQIELRINSGSANFAIFQTSLGNYIDSIPITESNYVTRIYNFQYVSGTPYIQFSNLSAGESVSIRNISVREIATAARQPSVSFRPLLGRAPKTGRRNILTGSDTALLPLDGGYPPVGSTLETAISAPSSRTSPVIGSIFLKEDGSTGTHERHLQNILTPVATYTISFLVERRGTARNLNLTRRSAGVFTVTFDFDALTAGSLSGSATGASVNQIASGVYLCSVTYNETTGGNNNFRFAMLNGTSFSYTGDNTSGLLVYAFQFELGSGTTAYQRVVSTTDITETGVPSYPFVRFDLSDDSLSSTVVSSKNLLRYTEEFDNAIWTKESCSISSNAIVSPDGNNTADKIVSANATAATRVSQSVANLVAADHTVTAYVKKSEAQFLQVSWTTTRSSDYANFDLDTGTVTVSVGQASISSVGNGWYRVSLKSTLTAGTGSAFFSIISAGNSARGSSFVGNGTSGLFIWGAQLELGTTATDYQYGGFSGDIIVAGRSGSVITNNVKLPDGTFTLGATSYSRGITNILRGIGDVVGWTLIGKSLTVPEKNRLVQLFKNRGAKGILVPGPELVTNGGFDTTANWSASNVNIANGVAQFPGGGVEGVIAQNISLIANRVYLIKLSVTGTTGLSARVRFGGQTNSDFINFSGNGNFEAILIAPAGSTQIQIHSISGTFNGAVDNVSVRELRPEEEW